MTFTNMSKNVAWHDYDAVEGKIRIQFRDGSIYEQPGDFALYVDLMNASSVGRFVREKLTALVKISSTVIELREPTTAAAQASETQPGLTDMFVDEGDCCAKRLGKAIAAWLPADSVEWECPQCGCLYRATMIPEASVRHWEPQSTIEVIRR